MSTEDIRFLRYDGIFAMPTTYSVAEALEVSPLTRFAELVVGDVRVFVVGLTSFA